jgi:hypothetical protein
MYESEIYNVFLNHSIADSIKEQFDKTNKDVDLCSILHWSEHCTECAMPTCFKTCDMYTPRFDGKCQRFSQGIQPLVEKVNGRAVMLKIHFKKWAVLETQANHFLYEWGEIDSQGKLDSSISNCIHRLPWPSFLKKKIGKNEVWV